MRAKDIKNQLHQMLMSAQLPVLSCKQNCHWIRKAILAGFFKNVAKKDKKCYRNIVSQSEVYVHPSSALWNKNPEYIVYHELVMTSKEYMRQVSVIEPKWLV